ncbi:hypothetical protein EAI_08841 [Harpegnathos saltator]|uniref:Uncharacterized protein n=1 Tax=Harpegnathos saltator TaxID=610380 RepID=E2CA25_HARSA|nr:hypothetical protein EAI_08841 [Harpegnathos saltator]
MGHRPKGNVVMCVVQPLSEWENAKARGTDRVKRRMIKRTLAEYSRPTRPKVWCPREDYHSPDDGISMSITSAYPTSSTAEKNEIAVYRSTEVKRREDGTFVLRPSKAIVTDAKCHRVKDHHVRRYGQEPNVCEASVSNVRISQIHGILFGIQHSSTVPDRF